MRHPAGAGLLRVARRRGLRADSSGRNDDPKMTGTADVTMGGVPWTKFGYSLGRKRSRY